MARESVCRLILGAAMLVLLAGPAGAAVYFADDFEDEAIGGAPAIGGTNVGMGYTKSESGGGAGTADQLLTVMANPNPVGNTSAQVLGWPGGLTGALYHHAIGQFTQMRSIDGTVISYDFYLDVANPGNTDDSVRSALANGTATDCWMRNDRDQLIKLDGNDQAQQNFGAAVWQNFTASFSQTAAGAYDLSWVVTNLETGATVGSVQAVLTNWDEIDGIMLEVFEGNPPGNDFAGYIDNVVVTPEPVSLLVLGLGGVLVARRRR